MKLFLLVLLIFFTRDALCECLHYEPTISSISGVLVRETFAGPPNYESIANGDEPETYFFIKPMRPFCTRASPTEDTDKNQENIKVVQLVFGVNAKEFYSSLRPRLGTAVTCSGILMSAMTGHHRSRVLLQVSECVRH